MPIADDVRRQRREEMKRKAKRSRMIRRAVLHLVALVAAVVAVYFVLRFVGFDVFDRSGWTTDENGAKQYLNYEGDPLTGWQTVDGKELYFTESGDLHTGWITLEGKEYYLTTEGVLSGWETVDGVQCYFDKDGVRQTGFLDRNGDRVYLYDDGTFATGWTDIGEHRYYFNEEGVAQTGWFEWEGDRYYLKEDGRMTKGQVTVDGVNHFFTSKGKYVLLVNAWNPVPEDYELVLGDFWGFPASETCVEALKKMVGDARHSGLPCNVDNVYRSKEVQQAIWDRKANALMEEGYSFEEAQQITGQSVMIPGNSEHQTGLAIDFKTAETTSIEWLHENCWDYGFIVRYPDGKTDYTGIIYEPWHLRYVGVELAKELQELGLCMEEYMEMLTEQNA